MLRVALKVDCDTYVGTREGIPRLLELFAKKGIRATFFFTFGPDRSGRAAKRFFTQKGYFQKMFRSGAGSLYGFRTALYGTLLPAPVIGERCAREMASVASAGHDTGVHAWDHVGWHDGLPKWSVERVRSEAGLAHAAYERVLGRQANAAAAAGWTVTEASLAQEAERGLLYTSNTRAGAPFFPEIAGRAGATLEIPTTLPTLDDTLAWEGLRDDEAQRALFRAAPRGTEVHTIHTEVEGCSKLPLFAEILADWKAAGVRFVTLEEIARETLACREAIPVRPVLRTTLPGRAGSVATGWPDMLVSKQA
jgi:undecaprenyl phosphate-alpha-L-ara4FN deformylase